MNYQDLFLFKIKKKKMSATKNECNRGSPSIYRPEANAWISKRSSDLDYKGVFALIKIGFLQSSFYEVMWSSLRHLLTVRLLDKRRGINSSDHRILLTFSRK